MQELHRQSQTHYLSHLLCSEGPIVVNFQQVGWYQRGKQRFVESETTQEMAKTRGCTPAWKEGAGMHAVCIVQAILGAVGAPEGWLPTRTRRQGTLIGPQTARGLTLNG